MGNSVVAVLLTDCCGEMENDDGRIGREMAASIKALPGARNSLDCDFHVGRVIAWDHSSAWQVVVAHGGTGWRLGAEPDPSWLRPGDGFQHALDNMRACLERHGYKVTKRRTT